MLSRSGRDDRRGRLDQYGRIQEDRRTGGTVMEWLVVAVFLVFIGGLVVVTTVAVKHAGKTLHNKPIKPTR